MDLDLVEELTRLFIRSELEEMEIEEEGFHLRLVRSTSPPSRIPSYPPSERPEETPSSVSSEEEKLSPPEKQWITATLVGRFQQADPPIQPGDWVEEGQVVGKIETMSVLNPVKAARSGRVVQVAVEEGQPVEYGQPLMEVEVEESAFEEPHQG